MSTSWKVCMVGAAGVGKTSLIRQYVEKNFYKETVATMGVKVTKKTVKIDGSEATLVLWDMAGDTEFILSKDVVNAARFQDRKTADMHAYILVADVSRLATLKEAIVRQQRIDRGLPHALPFVLALNKSDLSEKEFDEAEARRQLSDWQIVSTSAKTGEGVMQIFEGIAAALFRKSNRAG